MKHQQIKQLLPEVLQRTDHVGSPLYSLLDVMELFTEPAEEILQQIAIYFNAYTSPEKHLSFLARWVDLDRIFPASGNQDALQILDAGRLRELIVAAPQLSKLRGTSAGLKLFLETATGTQGFEINDNISDQNKNIIPFFINVNAPGKTLQYQTLIQRIIEQEKPAYATYQLTFIE